VCTSNPREAPQRSEQHGKANQIYQHGLLCACEPERSGLSLASSSCVLCVVSVAFDFKVMKWKPLVEVPLVTRTLKMTFQFLPITVGFSHEAAKKFWFQVQIKKTHTT
jgi:hypothetical protein